MKALEVIEETDPQGTVIGVQRVVDLQGRRIPPALLYLLLAAAVYLLMLAFMHTGSGVELQIVSISGNSSGQGLHSLEFAGDLLNVSIMQGNSSSFWHINASAMEAAS
jgi:hypothetical protein